MAGRLAEDDAELAYRHARAARRLASRVGIVREAAGLAAYYTGEWAEALAELRAARRLHAGEDSYLPVMADCERGLGRPERALDLVKAPEAKKLDPMGRVELRIVESGARRDLGQFDAAVVTLQVPELRDRRLRPWSARLFYAYADALVDAGRTEEASDWFARAAAADRDGETDAAERYADLEGLDILDTVEDEFGLEADVSEGGTPDVAAGSAVADQRAAEAVEASDVAASATAAAERVPDDGSDAPSQALQDAQGGDAVAEGGRGADGVADPDAVLPSAAENGDAPEAAGDADEGRTDVSAGDESAAGVLGAAGEAGAGREGASGAAAPGSGSAGSGGSAEAGEGLADRSVSAASEGSGSEGRAAGSGGAGEGLDGASPAAVGGDVGEEPDGGSPAAGSRVGEDEGGSAEGAEAGVGRVGVAGAGLGASGGVSGGEGASEGFVEAVGGDATAIEFKAAPEDVAAGQDEQEGSGQDGVGEESPEANVIFLEPKPEGPERPSAGE
ncbi:hypothetical protein [Actinomadura sp. J1-007]|nr:hypothetical protein [Actinomadura sp. J1-007]